MRITIRLRLTALIALLFAVLAGVLVATSYAFVANATTPSTRGEEGSESFREALREAGLSVPDPSPQPQTGHVEDGVSRAYSQVQAQARENVLHQLLTRSLFAFLIVAVVAIPLAYWLSGRILRPVDEISRTVNALSEKTLNQRLGNDGPDDEFGRLKTAFNGMLGRLESAFESRQRFAADASHELRTPLAVLEASADNVLEASKPTKQAAQLASEVKVQVQRAESLIASLLTLARADDVSNTRVATDLADVAATALGDLSDRASAASVEIEADLEDAPVMGDPILLERLIANLLDNAIRYNDVPGPGLPVPTVSLRVYSTESSSLVEVANSGPVVDAGSVPELFERFRRGGHRSEATGHGLGLPIVRRVAEVHGGTATAVARPEGGLDVRIELPRRAPSDT